MSLCLTYGAQAYDVELMKDVVDGSNEIKVAALGGTTLKITAGETVSLEGGDIAGTYSVVRSLSPAAPRGWRLYLRVVATSASTQAASAATADNATEDASDVFADCQTPLFGGSTGGLLSAADREEKYFISWTGKAGQVFEMPTGGAAEMVEGKNGLYLPRKETCLVLGAQLREYKIKDYQIFRIQVGNPPVLVHPKDGVFPEKSNEGRVAVNTLARNIGSNPEPATLKWSGTKTYD